MFLLLLAQASASYPACTTANTRVRKEWGSLTKWKRTDYIKAVQSMQSLPPRLSPAVVPGAKHRQDDFIATHINKTLSIHLDGIFLSWPRNFVWLWETALRDECGYAGAQPYCNWALWCEDLAASPLFDGSSTSLSGDGVYEADQGPYVVGGGATGLFRTEQEAGASPAVPLSTKRPILDPSPSFDLVFSGLPSNWTAY